MADFNLSFDFLMKHEGGYVDNPADRGGPTNMGMTIYDLSTPTHIATAEDIKNLSIAQAWDFYKAKFWDKMFLGDVKSDLIAMSMFDLSVVQGTTPVTKMIQGLVKQPVDGIMGPKTVKAINGTWPDKLIVSGLIKASQLRFVGICQKDATQLVFLKGWLNRTYSLLDLIIS